jgi:hypothetical protein
LHSLVLHMLISCPDLIHVAEFIHKVAKGKKVDSQTIVNKVLRSNKKIIQTLQ